MTGSYNALLVIASYCVAVIASYTAIYFGSRVFHLDGAKRRRWLIAGALCLGTGIWSMHFVGMSAYEMPMEMTMSFSAGLTLLSWLPALFASGLALHVITLPRVAAPGVVVAAFIMGVGIFSMHYLGMYAMQMKPAIQYDPLWVSISGAIAVGASGAALVICRWVRSVPAQQAPWVKVLAALVMGLAICGMHYSGMVGASYPMGASLSASNSLQGDWMGVPTAIVASALLLLAIYVAYSDLKAREHAREAQAMAQEKAHQAAFFDTTTGLGNRSFLEQRLLNRLRVDERGAPPAPFMILYFEVELMEDVTLRTFAQQLQAVFSTAEHVVRYGADSFMILHPPMRLARLKGKIDRLSAAVPDTGVGGLWGWGASQFPASASNSRGLIQVAQKVREWVRPSERSVDAEGLSGRRAASEVA